MYGFQIFSQKENREAQGALHEAWDQGLLDPLYFFPVVLDWAPPKPDPAAARLLELEPLPPRRNDQIIDQLDDPARDTRAQSYQDVSWFLNGPFLPNVAYEVARFVTAGDETGFVKLCWTYARVADEGIIELDFTNPFAVQEALGLGFDVNWYLRLVQGDFQETWPPPYVGPIAQFGGYGYEPLPQWSDYRFQWGSWKKEVFWLVPQYHKLSLLFEYGNAQNDTLTMIGGRLQGYTQPIDVRPTGWNVSHGWM